MRKLWSSCAASLLLAALPAGAATILERTVEIEIRSDGVTERESWKVRLDSREDLADWSPYPIYFNEHRSIEDVSASATTPEGKTIKVGRKDLDTAEVTSGYELHSSAKLRTVRFPAVDPGSVLTIAWTAKERPYFRGGAVALAQDDPVQNLRVTVRGGGPGWRWRIDGPRDGLTVQESAGGVAVTAAALPALEDEEDNAPGAGSRGAVLRYAWGEEASWAQVGRWYEGILAPLPRDAAEVRAKARELTAGIEGKRERVAALLGWVKKSVRYVAVEVGIGGYRPSPPRDVIERKWGDCKDKALLLVEMLREAGVEAYPALIRLTADERIDAEFPSPNQFNHLIVAIVSDGIAAEGDPVAGGYLWVDPTQTIGSLRWLHPGVQDQDALVVRGERSALVRTPIRQELEGYKLDVRLSATPEGDARGQASLDLFGDLGSAFLQQLADTRPDEVEHALRSLWGKLLPGVSLQKLQWTTADTDVPTLTVTADVHLAGLLPDAGQARSFSLPGMAGTPAPGILDGRTGPVVVSPLSGRTTWRIEMPEGWCPPKADQVEVSNEVGAFRQSITTRDRHLEVGREVELRQRWIEPARFPALKELALADHRANKRRIRLECP
jgi:transglutaminase-like putative cysteine protease